MLPKHPLTLGSTSPLSSAVRWASTWTNMGANTSRKGTIRVPSPRPPSTQLLPCATASFGASSSPLVPLVGVAFFVPLEVEGEPLLLRPLLAERFSGDLLRPRAGVRDLRALLVGVERSDGGSRMPAPERRLLRRMLTDRLACLLGVGGVFVLYE